MFWGGGDEKKDVVVTAGQPDPEMQKQSHSQVAVGQPIPDDLKQINDQEKNRILTDISTNSYARRDAKWNFRKGLGLRDFLIRIIFAVLLWLFAWVDTPKVPREREDKQWLMSFSFVLIITTMVLHGIAYFPSNVFGSCNEMYDQSMGAARSRLNEWNEIQYCAAIAVLIIVCYPLFYFVYLIRDGFNPYDELTYQEMRLEGGMGADLTWLLRVMLHFILIVATIYITGLFIFMAVIKRLQTYPGKYIWLAKGVSKMFYGTFVFQEGEFFDCAICFNGIWLGQKVTKLCCGDTHVYHQNCLEDQVATHGNQYCVLCNVPIKAVPAPAPED